MRTYPEAFLNRMRLQLGGDFPAFYEALQRPPKRALRVTADMVRATLDGTAPLAASLAPADGEKKAAALPPPPDRDLFSAAGA